jgi:hypothetical protein
MSVFAKYEMTTAKREKASPLENKRRKLISNIDDQICLIEADENDQKYTSKRKRWVTSQDGERRLIEQIYTPKKWYWQRDGRYVCQLKYGTKTLAIANKHNAILVDTLKEVKEVYALFRDTALKGDFDHSVSMALARHKKK